MILDEPHFKDLLLQHVSPPPASVSIKYNGNKLVRYVLDR